MAEFKLERFKFNWRGAWAAGTDYNRDDIVRVGGKSYVCLITHTASSVFNTDKNAVVPGSTPPIPAPKWVLMTSGRTFAGTWASGRTYEEGDIVLKDGTLWLCEDGVALSTNWAADEDKFTLFGTGIEFVGNWTTAQDYGIGALVKYNGNIYKCIVSHVASGAILEDQEDNWEIFHPGVKYRGDWDFNTQYRINDYVKYGGSVYRCVETHTSGTETIDQVRFEIELPGFEFEQEWISTVQYQAGDVVRQGGYVYYALNDNLDSNPTLDDSTINWTPIAYGYNFRGDWSQKGYYRPGDVIRRGGNLYVAVAPISAEANDGSTIDYLDPSTWELLFEGQAWSKQHACIEYSVTVENRGEGNKYILDASYKPELTFYVGNTYIFNQNNLLNVYYPNPIGGETINPHQLNFSTNSLNGLLVDKGNIYTDNVRYYLDNVLVNYATWSNNTTYAAATYRRVEITITEDTPTTLYYWCTNHTGMGNVITVDSDASTKTGSWIQGHEYLVGDVVTFYGIAYQCNFQHISDSRNYPGDNGRGYYYWDILIEAGLDGGLNNHGDLLTYNLSQTLKDDGSTYGNTNVPIGTTGQLLSVIDDDTVFWRNYLSDSDVIYVSETGTDADGYGTSFYKPFKTVRYACEFVEDNFSPLTPVKIKVATGRFVEIAPISVPAGCVIMGDELRATTIVACSALDAYANDYTYVKYYFTHLESIIFDVLNNNDFIIEPGNTIARNKTLPAAGTGTAAVVAALIDDFLQYSDFRILSTGTDATLVGTNTLTSTVSRIRASNIIVANKNFIARELSQHIVNNYPEYTFDQTRMEEDIRHFLRAVAYDLKYEGNYKTLLSANRYCNATLGSQFEDLFRFRDTTGIRNCTLVGLTGSLNPPGVFDLYRRPTGGAFCAFDPGWGPDDERVWIVNRSPYYQGVTNIGTACVGGKADGSLHNGGNKSFVANDFTQVLSDGVGCWISNNARAELVSVFTYYCSVGYLADNGGVIRATNGNNSYGLYGSVADGIDDTETPATAKLDNRNNQATSSGVFAGEFTDQIFAMEFTHTGENYTTATASIVGAGANADTEFVDFRDGAVYQFRLTNPDGSSDPGGLGYTLIVNNAQEGDLTSIKLASDEPSTAAEIIGQRLILVSGDGTGQYGYISTYSAATKIATIKRESDDQPGWDHILPGTPLANPLTSNTQYRIEPRMIVDHPGFSHTHYSLPGSNNIADAVYGNTTLTFSAIEGELGTGDVDPLDGLEPTVATFDIVKSGKNYIVTLNDGGAGYAVGDEIVITGDNIGGASPANDLTIIVQTTTEDSTNAIATFYSEGIAQDGIYMVLSADNDVAFTSSTGETWSSVTMPISGNYTKLKAANNRFLALRSNSAIACLSLNGSTWSIVNMPTTANWADVDYAKGKFIAIAENDNTVAISTNGSTWTSATIPDDLVGDSTATQWQKIAYGRGIWTVVGSERYVATSTDDGATWTRTANALPAGSYDFKSLVFGNGKFVALTSTGEIFYSFNGTTWTSGYEMPKQDGSTAMQWEQMDYYQGVFFAVCNTGGKVVGSDPTTGPTTYLATSENGLDWTGREVTTPKEWVCVATGNPGNEPTYLMIGTGSGSDAVCKINTGCRAKIRASLASNGGFNFIRMWDPGSGYDSSNPPNVTITDNSVLTEIGIQPRIGNGSLSQPSWINRGIGYRSSSTTVTITGDGYADVIPDDKYVTLYGLDDVPGPGAQLLFNGILDDATPVEDDLKIFSAVVVTDLGDDGTGRFKKRARIQVSPPMEHEYNLAHDTTVTIRERYSQCRISGHDFLDIGTGNFTNTNYPDLYAGGAYFVSAPENEILEQNGGRVFYTSTDQNGNFRTGELFAVEQATGIVTISADFFDLDGLSELALGGVRLGGSGAVIREFSTDPTFAADSNNIVPTQRAIATFLSDRLSVGGSDLETNALIAGRVFLGGENNEIGSTTGVTIELPTPTVIAGEGAMIQGSIVAQMMLHRNPFDESMQ